MLTYLPPVHDRPIIVVPTEKLKRVPYRGLLIINILLRIFLCIVSGDHPQENLAKSGYEPDMKHNSSIFMVTHNINQR